MKNEVKVCSLLVFIVLLCLCVFAVSNAHKSTLGVHEKEVAKICQDYLLSNAPLCIDSITNWDNPKISPVEKLPNSYYHISQREITFRLYKVVFTTTEDEILGSIALYVDENKTILGMDYRM